METTFGRIARLYRSTLGRPGGARKAAFTYWGVSAATGALVCTAEVSGLGRVDPARLTLVDTSAALVMSLGAAAFGALAGPIALPVYGALCLSARARYRWENRRGAHIMYDMVG